MPGNLYDVLQAVTLDGINTVHTTLCLKHLVHDCHMAGFCQWLQGIHARMQGWLIVRTLCVAGLGVVRFVWMHGKIAARVWLVTQTHRH